MAVTLLRPCPGNITLFCSLIFLGIHAVSSAFAPQGASGRYSKTDAQFSRRLYLITATLSFIDVGSRLSDTLM